MLYQKLSKFWEPTRSSVFKRIIAFSQSWNQTSEAALLLKISWLVWVQPEFDVLHPPNIISDPKMGIPSLQLLTRVIQWNPLIWRGTKMDLENSDRPETLELGASGQWGTWPKDRQLGNRMKPYWWARMICFCLFLMGGTVRVAVKASGGPSLSLSHGTQGSWAWKEMALDLRSSQRLSSWSSFFLWQSSLAGGNRGSLIRDQTQLLPGFFSDLSQNLWGRNVRL